MITFENTVFIERPIEEVFAFVADLQKIPKWNYYVRSVTPTSVETGAVGSTYHQIRKSDEQDLRIASIEWNRSLVIETIPPSRPELRREMTFQAHDGGTRIVDRWRLNMGVPMLLEPLAANRAKAGVVQNLGKLRVLLETGRATLQDGRAVSL